MRLAVVAAALALVAGSPPLSAGEGEAEEGTREQPVTAVADASSAEEGEGAGSALRLGTFRLDSRLRAMLGSGALRSGWTLERSGGVTEIELTAKPHLWRKGLHVRVPLKLVRDQTFGASLDETRGDAALDVAYRLSRELRVTGEVGAVGRWRPSWPDPYQPLPGGRLARTARRSYIEWQAKAGVAWRPARGQKLRLDYDYALRDAYTDPAFAPLAAPLHLAPSDRVEHAASLAWSITHRSIEAGARVTGAWRRYGFYFARDAETGLTHAASSTHPANPLEVRRRLEPALYAEAALSPRLRVRVGYGYEIQQDAFQGYDSYRGHHPEAGLSYEAAGLSARLSLEARLRRYGPSSYAPSCSTAEAAAGAPCARLPFDAFDGGSEGPRDDQRLRARVRAEQAFSAGWAVFFDGSYRRRRTSFPDYVAGVNSPYDIDWDYDNYRVIAGVVLGR